MTTTRTYNGLYVNVIFQYFYKSSRQYGYGTQTNYSCSRYAAPLEGGPVTYGRWFLTSNMLTTEEKWLLWQWMIYRRVLQSQWFERTKSPRSQSFFVKIEEMCALIAILAFHRREATSFCSATLNDYIRSLLWLQAVGLHVCASQYKNTLVCQTASVIATMHRRLQGLQFRGLVSGAHNRVWRWSPCGQI